MNTSKLFNNRSVDRRTLLRGAGVVMALPWLDSMLPALAAEKREIRNSPQRFIGISNGLGFHAPYFFPQTAGHDYQASRYLKPIDHLREHFTVISGVSHPDVGGGHKAVPCILTAAPYSGTSFCNSISLDQLMAQRLGGHTRFPSLVLASQGTTSTSYTANGSMIPPENSPQRLFDRLFVEENASAKASQRRRLREGQSIMDAVASEAKAMKRRLGATDRNKLDEYFTSVRDLESRLQMNEAWVGKPKPEAPSGPPAPVDDANDTIARQAAMYDVMFLAVQTDSARFMTMHTEASGQRVPIDGVSQGYHQLSHHGLNEEKISQLALIEEAQMMAWGKLLQRLHDAREGGTSLLDQTMLFLTSNLGNASSHDTKNMPVIIAGGGFKHAGHLAFDRTDNYPLPNLYTSMLQRMGLEIDAFASATGTMQGLL